MERIDCNSIISETAEYLIFLFFENRVFFNVMLQLERVKELVSVGFVNRYIQGVPGGMCQTSGGCSLC
jgi:hypothetical protein